MGQFLADYLLRYPTDQEALEAALLASADTTLYCDDAPLSLDRPVHLNGSLRIADLNIRPSGKFAVSAGERPYLLIQDTGNAEFGRLKVGGQFKASWLTYAGSVRIDELRADNPHLEGEVNPGIDRLGRPKGAGLHIDDAVIGNNQAVLRPDERTCVGIRITGPDAKIGSLVSRHFRHGLIVDGGAIMLGRAHVYQGISGQEDTPGYLAGIKMVNGATSAGLTIGMLYLDKCSVEMSNEYHTRKREIGNLRIACGHSACEAGEDFTFIVARDYGNATRDGKAILQDVSISNFLFYNEGSASVRPTRLYNPENFESALFHGINVGEAERGNQARGAVLPIDPDFGG